MGRKQRAELRNEMIRIMGSIDRRWIEAASHEISQHLTRLLDAQVGRRIEHVLAWTSFYPGEIDLTEFISGQIGKRRVYVPRVLEERTMTFISVEEDWLDSFEPGLLGIPAPRLAEHAVYQPSAAYDTAVLVPGLAFDHEGNRVGRD